MDEVLKFVTPDGVSEKKEKKNVAILAKISQFWDLFRLHFGLKDPVRAA